MIKLSAPSCRRILKVVDEATEPLTAQQITKLAHVSFASFKNHARPRLIEEGLIHQSGWQKYSNGFLPTYSKGTGKTPRRPKGMSASERCKDWREHSAKHNLVLANRRLANPDPITAALMGL